MAEDFLHRIVAHKKEEVATTQKKVPLSLLRNQAETKKDQRGFIAALMSSEKKVNIIAEIKRASPSKGAICLDLDPIQLATAYQAGGAACLSVLTDNAFFKGSLEDMVIARNATTLPVLRKEFILSEYQVYEAAAAGADALLLIVRILSQDQLKDLLQLTLELGMDALVEVYSEAELDRAKAVSARLIGINNRNLKSFDTDINHAMRLFNRLDANQIGIAASGITGPKDVVTNIRYGVYNFLIGESLVRSENPTEFLKSLHQVGSDVI
jgi:indole-3-glycerol phosphate synthase